jgi:hypothetical protein
MDLDLLLNQGLAIFLIVGGGLFAVSQIWPYIRDRDVEERQRGYALALNHATADQNIAASLDRIAHRLEKPILIELQNTSND